MTPHFGLTIKGGYIFDPEIGKFRAIVHIWDNPASRGIPTEYLSKESFDTEQEAIHHYETHIRPTLLQLCREMKENP